MSSISVSLEGAGGFRVVFLVDATIVLRRCESTKNLEIKVFDLMVSYKYGYLGYTSRCK
jgi:hypothetical protein